MNAKMKIKMLIDFFMTILLLMLMAYQVTGERLHEWLGVFMIVLFIIHQFLNIGWYGRLFKGKYKPLRILQTAVNFSLLVTMFSLAYSGVIMSNYVFAFLPIHGGMALARVMHLAASYWCLVLAGIHLGLHLRMVAGILDKVFPWEKPVVFKWLFRLLGAALAGYYPYEIERNYFSQENLTTQPGQYRQTTVAVDSFSPNQWGLYNMHGNVGEWVWDYYGDYSTEDQTDPAGPETGTLRVYRGGGWNDFAKNMRSAYRAALTGS